MKIVSPVRVVGSRTRVQPYDQRLKTSQDFSRGNIREEFEALYDKINNYEEQAYRK